MLSDTVSRLDGRVTLKAPPPTVSLICGPMVFCSTQLWPTNLAAVLYFAEQLAGVVMISINGGVQATVVSMFRLQLQGAKRTTRLFPMQLLGTYTHICLSTILSAYQRYMEHSCSTSMGVE